MSYYIIKKIESQAFYFDFHFDFLIIYNLFPTLIHLRSIRLSRMNGIYNIYI